MCWNFLNVVTIRVDCSSRHQRDLSHNPCCNNHCTWLTLICECCTSYRTLYDVTAASEWTAPLKVVHVLLCCVFLAMLGLIPFNLELTFTSSPLRSVRTSHTPSLTHYITYTLTTIRVILLTSVQHRGQGITLRPTVWTPTWNDLRSNWDFIQGRCPWHVGGSNTVNIYIGDNR